MEKWKISKEQKRSMLVMLVGLLLGSMIYAISIDVFYNPAKLLGGGVTGFAQLLNFRFGVSTSMMVLLINIPLFVLAFVFVDRTFTVFSLLGMLILSFFLHLFSGISLHFESPLTSVVVGGVVSGLGLGLIYRSGASVGGTDIISKILQKYFAGNMAYTGLAINVVVIATAALIYGIDQAVLTLSSMYISTQVNTWVIDGVDHRRAISIITEDPDGVSQAIIREVHRGVTVLKGYGAYSRQEHDMLYCVISKRQLAKIKRVIKEADPKAFFTITRVTGVYGNGSDFFSVLRDIH